MRAALHERLDLHNAAVDDALARRGGCGALHLASGRRCVLPNRHSGSCHFEHEPVEGDVKAVR